MGIYGLGVLNLEKIPEFFENPNRIPCEFLRHSLGILWEFLGNSLEIPLEFFEDVWLGVLNVWVLVLGSLTIRETL